LARTRACAGEQSRCTERGRAITVDNSNITGRPRR
jgi:hypothetical protein